MTRRQLKRVRFCSSQSSDAKRSGFWRASCPPKTCVAPANAKIEEAMLHSLHSSQCTFKQHRSVRKLECCTGARQLCMELTFRSRKLSTSCDSCTPANPLNRNLGVADAPCCGVAASCVRAWCSSLAPTWLHPGQLQVDAQLLPTAGRSALNGKLIESLGQCSTHQRAN